MRLFQNIMLFSCFLIFSGCFPLEEEKTVTLSFWTDQELILEGLDMVFANEIYIGNFMDTLSNPTCTDPKLLNFTIEGSEDLNLSIRNELGESIEIGVINLFSVSTGLKIKPTEEGEIFVDRSLDDVCTLVYLNWD